jgi:hypothetical protein
MPLITPEQFAVLLPLACAWAEEQEQIILQRGISLSAAEMADAKRIGLWHPEQVRVLAVESIPMPRRPALKMAAEATGLLSPLTAGLTLRYGISIRSDCWGERRIAVHELAHVAQYERLGGFEPFLRQYLQECLTFGYPAAPLEQEAKRVEQEICRISF